MPRCAGRTTRRARARADGHTALAMATGLPVDEIVPGFVSALAEHGAAVVIAPPGAGKTTRLPRAVLEAGLSGEGAVVVAQPRRLAARMAAGRVAAELGESVGDTVGYEVRFERRVSGRTRIRFVTEGVLTRQLIADPELRGVGAVIVDEFHERHVTADLALSIVRRLQLGARPDLRVAVMSATLDPSPVTAFLGHCPVLESRGRVFDIDIEHAPGADELPLERKVSGAVRRLVKDGLTGHVLVFLPGEAEIRRAAAACADVAAREDLEVCPLYGAMPTEAQDRAVAASRRRKVVLATNVAETSITIAGVEAVVDSGLVRVASHSPWTGVPSLRTAPISQASAAQRAGRAGRTGPGRCIRLYTKADHDGRRSHDRPEIARIDLAEPALELHAAGVREPAAFSWFEPPPEAALSAAETLLRRLDAVDDAGALTETGRRMTRFPLHPRLSRMLVEANERGASAEGAVLAALAGERPLRRARRGGGGSGPAASGPSDLLEDLDEFLAARDAGLRPERLRNAGIDVGTALSVDRASRQLSRLLSDAGQAEKRSQRAGPLCAQKLDRALLIATLTGYPDRLCRRRRAGGRELVLAGGETATLSASSVVVDADLMVAADVESRGAGGAVTVRSASAVEPDWLLELYLERIEEQDQLAFSPSAERVERVRRMSLHGLCFDEHRDPAAARDRPEETARILADAARAAGSHRFVDGEALSTWRLRIAFVQGHIAPERAAEIGLAYPDDEAVFATITELCAGLSSLAELERMPVFDALCHRLPPAARRAVDELAPRHVALPRRRRVPVSYEKGRPPRIASRLQDFFGLSQGPAIAGGRVPLVLELLAPNGRAVQVTQDLAGFWQRHYPALRKQLARRYPRHAWPEQPV